MSAALTALYRARLAAVTGQALGRVRTLWLAQFDPAEALATIGLAGRAAGDWITVAQDAAAAEAAAYLAALVAEASGAPVAEVLPFASPQVAGTSAAQGVPVADLTGMAPGVYAARTAAGAPPEAAARAAAEWLNRLSASEPFRAANVTVLHGAATDDRLTGRVERVARPSACEFCRLIADRGYIPANAGFAAHAHCRCTASPEISSRVYSRAAQRRAARAYAVRLPRQRAALRSGHDHPERATTATGPAPGPGATGPGPAAPGPGGAGAARRRRREDPRPGGHA